VMLSPPRLLPSMARSLRRRADLRAGSAQANGRPVIEAGASDRTIRAFLYDADLADGHVSLQNVDVERLTPQQLLWVDVSHKQDVSTAAAALGLSPETVQAVRASSAEPALFMDDGYVHLVVVAPGNDAGTHSPHLLHCLAGSNWVLTVHEQPIDFLGDFDDRMRGTTNAGKIDSHGFLAAILHDHVASYLAELRPIEADLDRLDLRSMTGRIDDETVLRELVRIRLRLAKLRRLLEPHRELYPLLAQSEFALLSEASGASDFPALTDLLERTLQSMETTREMIVGSFEIYPTWTAHGTNKVMKRLTVASVTLLPPTLLAGVMGMNSLPGALSNTSAFWISTAAMSSLALTTIVVAWLRQWI
jgi:magnesium transporter